MVFKHTLPFYGENASLAAYNCQQELRRLDYDFAAHILTVPVDDTHVVAERRVDLDLVFLNAHDCAQMQTSEVVARVYNKHSEPGRRVVERAEQAMRQFIFRAGAAP